MQSIVPASTSAAITIVFTSGWSGFMIAEVIPLEIAIARKVPVMWFSVGRPKLTFDAPQVGVHLELVAQAAQEVEHLLAVVPMAPIGMTSGSTTMSLAGMP